jgi:hypothetical protein
MSFSDRPRMSIGRLQESVRLAQVSDAETDYLRTAAEAILTSIEVCLICREGRSSAHSGHQYSPARVVPMG